MWNVGDMAICINRERIMCTKHGHTGVRTPPLKSVRTVTAIGASEAVINGTHYACDCVVLHFGDGAQGLHQRFRKVDKPEPCEQEFVTLLKRIKTRQPGEVETV